jgi:hypothetical protein
LFLEHVIHFVTVNKQAIKYSLEQQEIASGGQKEGGGVMSPERFNVTKFIAAMIMKEDEVLRLRVPDCERYIKPMAKEMRKLLND